MRTCRTARCIVDGCRLSRCEAAPLATEIGDTAKEGRPYDNCDSVLFIRFMRKFEKMLSYEVIKVLRRAIGCLIRVQ